MKYSYKIIVLFVCLSNLANAKTWHIGLNEQYTYCSQVAALVNDFDSVIIHYFHYKNDKQVTWTKNNLSIIGIDKPILEAGDIIENDQSNGKGIFVIAGQNIVVENIEFRNARVPDRNGAGIRQEACNLILRDCDFIGNEMGILCGTIANCKTTIEFCTFKGNGSPLNPGYQHNVYINNIDTLIFQYNVSLDAVAEGHELKSRAKFNYIAYNWIANIESEDSRTIDLPNGGISLLIGNVILQGPNSANNNIIGYGLEGLSNPSPHNLVLINNTIVNKKDRGSFIHIPINGCDSLLMYNNIFAGKQSTSLYGGNPLVVMNINNLESTDLDSYLFVDLANNDYQLTALSPCYNAGFNLDAKIGQYSLKASQEFRDGPLCIKKFIDHKIDIGAFELTLLSAAEISKTKTLLSPNPFSDFLKLKELNGGAIRVYDVNGHQMLKDGSGAEINTQKWAQGMYIATDGKSQQKLLKIK
jgi:hypothetical protein